ncbi:MAG: hypothetical protein ACIPMY_04300, partial [Rickettsia endosymbiont of Pentastiridius leporinus]
KYLLPPFLLFYYQKLSFNGPFRQLKTLIKIWLSIAATLIGSVLPLIIKLRNNNSNISVCSF